MTTTPINYYHMNDPHLDQRNATQHLPLKTHGKILDKILVDNIPKYVMILINSYVQFTPNCKDELQIAVKEWNQSPDEAFKKYGDVRFWDVSKVTDMASLFSGFESFNENRYLQPYTD